MHSERSAYTHCSPEQRLFNMSFDQFGSSVTSHRRSTTGQRFTFTTARNQLPRAYLIATVAAPSLRLARASATLGLVDSIGLNRSWRRGLPTLSTMRIQTEKRIMRQQHDVKEIFALVGYITLYIVFESYMWIDTHRCTMDPGDSWCLK